MAAVGVGIAVIIAIIIAGHMAVCKFDQAYARGDDKMAKLNGVEIIEMKDGAVTKIKYDGEEYEYTEKLIAREGSIVQNLSVTLDAEIGAFYETDRRGVVVDDEGDSHDFINTYGRTFVKTQETARAKEGDLVRIIDKYSEGQPYDNGDVFVVSRTYGDGDIRVNNNSHFLLEQEYRVIDPKEDTPQVGDKILVYDSFISDDQYTNGDVLKVTEVSESGSVRAEGVDVGLIRREFEIVPTDTPVRKSSTCVKDDLNGRVDELEERVGKLGKDGKTSQNIEVGDHVRVTGETLWDDIDEGTVVKVTSPMGSDGEYQIELLDGSDYDYVEPENLEKMDVNARELSFIRAGRHKYEVKDGDIVKVVRNKHGHGFDIGEVIYVHESRTHCSLSFEGRRFGEDSSIAPFMKSEEVTLVTPVEKRTDIEHGDE